jgi:predicted nucleic acid-binding protein
VILADTSVWIDFLRKATPEMQKLLADGQILMHPFIVAEISLGSMRNRKRVLDELESLLEVGVAQLAEVRQMIEVHALYSIGIGLTDAHLLASCMLTSGTTLWTRDAAMKRAAKVLGIPTYPA